MAILGTAPSWRRTPWDDPGLEIWSLNDAYRLGFPRADRWFDLHPFDHFYYPDPKAKQVHAKDIPVGFYVRPQGYVEWLSQLQIPLYLQHEPPAGFGPQAQVFPKSDMEAQFGRYFTSTPAWMLSLAVAEGFNEIRIYGIHLSTESEYIEQRPNFEYLIGRVLGRGKVSITEKDGMRYYESPDGMVALPEESPVLQSDFQYAFQTRPRAVLMPLQVELGELQHKREKAIQALKKTPWYRPASSTRAELEYLDAAITDAQQALGRTQMAIGG